MMNILKDFIRMIFGLPEDEHVPTGYAIFIIVMIVFIGCILMIAR